MRFRGLWLVLLVPAVVRIAISQSPEKIQLVGVGTTSPLAVYSKWFQAFEDIHPELHITYLPSGSATGIDMVSAGTSDFGGTDAPMTPKQLANGKVVQFATVLLAMVPIYNIPGLARPLKFSPQALAGIYLGKITKWNDPAISRPSPEIHLPASDIAVIHSASGRGSTYIWSDYLSKVSVEWRTKIGRGIATKWPVGTEADGNGNVARMVKETPNSIAYVELGYAKKNGLPWGQVQNAAGNFISADPLSVSAAATAVSKAMPSDFRASVTNPPGDRAYPISSFTRILVSENMASPIKQAAVKDFLRWILNEGQAYVDPAGFTRLPGSIVEQELKAVEEIP